MKIKNLNILLVLFSIYIIIISIDIISPYKCGFDQLKMKPYELDSTDYLKKLNKVIEYTPIKIKIDYSSLTKIDSITDEAIAKIKELIESTVSEFQKILKIRHVNEYLYNLED